VKKQTQKTTRRRFGASEKSKILKLHLVEGRPISSVCEEHSISPSRFYSWQALLFQNADNVFDRTRGPKLTAQTDEIKRLEATVREKDGVIAELMAEYLKGKKKIGENS
jgi:transposase-like protein